MASKRCQRRQPLTLYEIIEELECIHDVDHLPSAVDILTPENANADITDEDSGDEEVLTWHNLPGSQLRGQANFIYSDDELLYSEDELPLSEFAKRRCIEPSVDQDAGLTEATVPEPISSSSSHEHEPIPTTSSHEPVIAPSVPVHQKYQWRNYHIPLELQQRRKVEGQKNLHYYFDCMFDKHCIDLSVIHTNMYASKKNKVGNVTIGETKCFLSILLFSGYVPVPQTSMYLENSKDADFGIVNSAMSRDRFDLIMTNIHCCDNLAIQTIGDKFAKLRLLFDLLYKQFLELAPLEEHYSVDEAIVPYYERHSCKQFIREKPIRWGYKYWIGSTRSGYVLWFEPCQGKSETSRFDRLDHLVDYKEIN